VVSAIFAKFSLEELTLIAVITGDANPRAMFRDPTGLGQTVKRGDYLSRSAARITKILSDRVVLEMSEITPGGATKALERAVLVNPEGTDQ
jgi:Tfp pilus assembly protein PilP